MYILKYISYYYIHSKLFNRVYLYKEKPFQNFSLLSQISIIINKDTIILPFNKLKSNEEAYKSICEASRISIKCQLTRSTSLTTVTSAWGWKGSESGTYRSWQDDDACQLFITSPPMSQLTARVIRVAHPEGRVVDVAVNHEGGRASFGRNNGTKAGTPRLPQETATYPTYLWLTTADCYG